MSEHAWVQEHVAAYLAGGLDAQEAERLEAHARDCSACGAALADARRLDDCLSNLFVSARPALALEDRAVGRLRTAPPAWRLMSGRRAKWAMAVAAVLLLGVLGAGAGSLTSRHGPLMPGGPMADPAAGGEYYLAQEGMARTYHRRAEVSEKTPPGLDSNRESYRADLVRSAMIGLDMIESDKIGQPNSPDAETAWAMKGLADSARPGRAVGPLVAPLIVPPNYSSAPRFDPTAIRPAATEPFKAPNPKADPDGKADPERQQPKGPADPKTAGTKSPEPNPEPTRRIVIRSGDMEFEVESFDGAIATVTKLVLDIRGAFVSTVNSDKLPNGKVKGSITVRVPPEQLDGLVLDLRRELAKGGELKGVKLSSQDVTKMYTDLESRLKAARTMEQRLLQIIKEGKGEIKQLLEAEKELGIWRTKIEETEGEIRYYSNLAAFSTLTITLSEKEIRAAAAITERERVQAGVEVEDVDKAYQQVLAAVVEAKGRITKSEMKQLSAGQFNATFHFEVAAEASGPIRDRLRMLGRVARLEIDRSTHTEGGTLPSDAKPKRGDTIFLVQIYNLANVAPRETTALQVAVPDVPAAYQALRDVVAKTTGRVLVAQLNETDRQNITAEFDFEVRRTEEGAVRAALDAAGEVLARQVVRAAESDSVTDTKVMYKVTLLSANRLRPRETTTMAVEVADVDGTATVFGALVAEVKGRQVDAKLDRDGGKATARLVFEVPLAAAAGLVERFKSSGTVRLSQSTRDPQATEGKYATARLHVTVTNVEAIVPEGTGLWPKVRQGLSISASVLLTSVTWLVFGLCVVLPWAVIGFGGYRVVRRFVQPVAPAVVVAPAPTVVVAPTPTSPAAPTTPPAV